MVLGEVWEGPEKKLYSQGNEELIIRDFFQDRKGGFFLDVGSSEPVEGSTTYYLEKHLGWSGIAVDALSEYADSYAELRPRTRFHSYIVTDHSGKKQKFYRVVGAPGLSSTTDEREFAGVKLRSNTIIVPTITMDELLEREKVEQVDFLSMDIEGGEPRALAAFDIQKYRPRLICIESKRSEESFDAWFGERGYVRIDRYRRFDHVNSYYTPAK
jgi:FkbM family methyltransferase